MKRIEISIDSPAGRTVCALAEQLNLDPQDVLQGILFGLCNRRKREPAKNKQKTAQFSGKRYLNGIEARMSNIKNTETH